MRREVKKRPPRNIVTEKRRSTVIRRKLFLPVDFDWKIYLHSHADLRRAGLTTQEQAEEHFLNVGHTENRIYSESSSVIKTEKPASIDSSWLTDMLRQKKGVVFTCVSGAYDTLKEPVEVDPHWDYICFTNVEGLTSKTWDIRPIPAELSRLPEAKRARAIKILPHKYLPGYDYSFWVDASILIKRSVTPFVSQALRNEKGMFAIPKHPDRICVYEEADAVKRMKKDVASVVDLQIKKYKSEGYPSNWGLVQSGLMIRRKDQDVINFCNLWWKEVEGGSKRDQLSFNYTLYKKPIPVIAINPAAFGSVYFLLHSHKTAKKEPFPVRFRRDYGRLENYLNGKKV